MTENRELVRRVAGLAAVVVIGIAAGGWLIGGLDQAAGALAGGVITIGNFVWLDRVARVALERAQSGSRGRLRAVLWLGASGARLGVVALALGVAATHGRLGLAGLVVALVALPMAVVTEGLRAARAS